MALVKFYSGGKVIRVLRDLEIKQIKFNENAQLDGPHGSTGALRIVSTNNRSVLYDWRGDFLIDWTA